LTAVLAALDIQAINNRLLHSVRDNVKFFPVTNDCPP
jgi:hypothetical protein